MSEYAYRQNSAAFGEGKARWPRQVAGEVSGA